jgi:hypothetical protein
LDFKSFSEVDRLTIPEYRLLMQASKLKQVDLDYRVHQLAFANFRAQAQKKNGKNKTVPVFRKFKQFFDYEKAVKKAQKIKEEKDDSLLLDFSKKFF